MDWHSYSGGKEKQCLTSDSCISRHHQVMMHKGSLLSTKEGQNLLAVQSRATLTSL